MSKSFFLLLVLFALGDCEEDCGGHLSCLEKKFVDYVDKVEASGTISNYVVLEKVSGRDAKEEKRDEGIVQRCVRFLAEHQLKLRLPAEESRGLETEARSRKIRKLILPLLLILKLKASIIFPILLSIVAIVAFKGLGAGLTALTIAGAIGLKNLVETAAQGHSKVSYEIVPQVAPHWSRSAMEPDVGLGMDYHTLV
ncbi:unnamed protein product [Acanthoscelides obtectus]|uniref:Uncharacterized protein n=1 Tax=Acanthoscelides obtectus TaxID=200917 RepID=A0A9P0K449_ACAOB|nr:unnamed protein product [Acanthoscelides obtectus]CAK1648125.1 hypothetical protein AOBTE_LOCUS15548 [Acanthoscelides obtectus]